MVKVVTDSTSDIPAELVETLGITVVPSYVMFGTESYRDGVELSREQFYEKLASTKEIPSTAAPPPAVYEQVYRRLADRSVGLPFDVCVGHDRLAGRAAGEEDPGSTPGPMALAVDPRGHSLLRFDH